MRGVRTCSRPQARLPARGQWTPCRGGDGTGGAWAGGVSRIPRASVPGSHWGGAHGSQAARDPSPPLRARQRAHHCWQASRAAPLELWPAGVPLDHWERTGAGELAGRSRPAWAACEGRRACAGRLCGPPCIRAGRSRRAAHVQTSNLRRGKRRNNALLRQNNRLTGRAHFFLQQALRSRRASAVRRSGPRGRGTSCASKEEHPATRSRPLAAR